MSPETATASATEPNEHYDALNQTGQDVWDFIGSMGYRPDKKDDDTWVALDLNGDNLIGPKDTLSELAEAVTAFVGANQDDLSDDDPDSADDGEPANASGPKVHKLKADSKGNVYLPGTEPIVDVQIAEAAGKAKAIATEWNEKGKERKQAYADLMAVAHAKKHLFKKDPENSNALIYRAGDLVVRLKNDVKETVEVEIVNSSEDGD